MIGRVSLFLLLALLAVARPIHAATALDGEFDAIVSTTTQQNHVDARARMLRWIEAHQGDPQCARGLLWIAVLERGDGRGEAARPLLERILREVPDTEWALNAERQLADLDLDIHQYRRAIETYDRLAALPSPYWHYIGKTAGDDARSQRARFYSFIAIVAALHLIAATRIARMGLRALWPLPNELAYPLPALLVILVAAAEQEPAEARGVITLSLGAIALLWINGAWLRAHPPRGPARTGQALLGVLQACGLFFCAIISSGLWEKLVDTWQMGAD